jgi:DNA adenine methylase
MGGKVRIAKYLVPVLQERLKDKDTFVDLFCGSCNIVSAIKAPNRIANDLHKELIALHKAVQSGWVPPSVVTEEDYKQAKQAEDHLKAFIGFGCSFSGIYFCGYARGGGDRNYALNAKNTLLKKHQNMKDVQFFNLNYSEVNIPSNSLVYCDIPYKDTTKYSTDSFDHPSFYSWLIAENANSSKV